MHGFFSLLDIISLDLPLARINAAKGNAVDDLLTVEKLILHSSGCDVFEISYNYTYHQ